jgi:hypothetical protein
VLVQSNTVNPSTLVLQEGEAKYLSVGDFLDGDETVVISAITGDTITLTADDPASLPTVSAGQTITFDMFLGSDTTTGSYIMNETLDRGETPQIKMRIFWWFPNVIGYEPNLKYLRTVISGRSVFDYFFFNKDPVSPNAASGSIRELLDIAVTPSQADIGGPAQYREFKSSTATETLYVPKSALSQITKASINISFVEGNRSAEGNFTATEIGNYIVPTSTVDFDSVFSKNIQIKDLLGSNIASTVRLVSDAWTETRDSYPVSIIDHNGLVDYFVANSSGNIVTVSDTSRLRKNLICITSATNANDFVRITEIISSTQFETSANLNLSSGFLYIYANAGILDRSLDTFCVGVFGQTLASTAIAGTKTLVLTSVDGVELDQVVQFDQSIDVGSTVEEIVNNTITISKDLLKTINQDETIIFAPFGTTTNKEICVLPLDLSPPFIGVDTGLDTNQKSIRSSESSFNLKVSSLEFRNTTVNNATITEDYNRKISIANSGLSIIARKL